MPGRSAALSFTVDRITASWVSLVGWCSSLGMPRIISGLTADAKRRRTPIDSVRRHEPAAPARAGKTATSVGGELLDERSALTLGIAIIPEAGPARSNCLGQNFDDRVAQSRSLIGRH